LREIIRRAVGDAARYSQPRDDHFHSSEHALQRNNIVQGTCFVTIIRVIFHIYYYNHVNTLSPGQSVKTVNIHCFH